MARTPGSLNKNTIVKTDSEDIFLADVLAGHTKWKAEAARRKEAGESNQRELDYAEAYRLLLNKFSAIEPDNEE